MYKVITIRSLLRRARYYGSLLTREVPDVCFIVFAQGRTGGTLLTELLDCHPKIHCAGEVLSIGKTRIPLLAPYHYTLGAACHSGATVYGYRVKVYQLSRHQRRNPRRFLRQAHAEGWKIVYLRRKNLLRHALSNVVAEHLGQWNYKKSEKLEREPVRVDADDLLTRIGRREKYLAAEAEALDGLPYLEIIYEDDLEPETAKQATCDRIFDFLGVGSSPVETSLKKINKGPLKEFIANYEEVKTRIADAGYHRYLDDT